MSILPLRDVSESKNEGIPEIFDTFRFHEQTNSKLLTGILLIIYIH